MPAKKSATELPVAILETMAQTSKRIFALLRSIAKAVLTPTRKAPPRGTTGPAKSRGTSTRPAQRPAQAKTRGPASSIPATGLSAPYPGDFHGRARIRYSPKPDGAADPGEIVWTWVPFEEDHSQGKDRPVLIVGRSGSYLLALMLTSKDHTNARRRDADYVDIGTGSWDRQGRPSEVKLDRILQISPADLRREGAVLDAGRFDVVAAGLKKQHGWS